MDSFSGVRLPSILIQPLLLAGANFLNMIVAAFFVYETADLTLECIDEMYGDESVNAWTSSKWVPAGFASRGEMKGTVENADSFENVVDEKQGRWKSKPDPVTGEEQDHIRKAPETAAAVESDPESA